MCTLLWLSTSVLIQNERTRVYFYQLFAESSNKPQQRSINFCLWELNDISLLFYWKQLVILSTKYLKYVLYNLVMVLCFHYYYYVIIIYHH